MADFKKLALVLPDNNQTALTEAARTTIPSKVNQSSDEGCALCLFTGMVATSVGMKNCECRIAATRRRFHNSIPTEFGIPTFASVQPDLNRHPAQAEKIADLRRDPERSYFIYGDNGAGKTFMAWMLVVEAFERGNKVVAIELDKLLKQYRRWQFVCDEPGARFRKDRPAVLATDLEQKSRQYTIFLDEIGGTSVTEYAAKEFFYLLKAAAEYGHQTILTCDVRPRQLTAIWRNVTRSSRNGAADESLSDAHWGNKIARRIAEYSTQVDLFREPQK